MPQAQATNPSSPSPHVAAVEPVCPTERNHKKTDQWGNQLAGSAPSGHFLELQGYRRATVPKSHVRPPTFSTKPSRSSNFTPRSLFSSSAGCEILNEPVRTGATRVRLADSAGAPAVTCRGVPAGSREG